MSNNVLASARAWLGGMFRRHASEPITYRRGTAAVLVPAHKAATELHSEGELIRLATNWRDFFLDYGELVLPAIGQTLPVEGDLIEEVDGRHTYVYKVLPPMQGSPCYQWASGQRYRLRVHTKLLETR